MMQILKYVIVDILRNKVVVAYTVLLAAFSWTAFSLEDNPGKGLLTILNIVLLIVPLVSILFSTIYLYNSNEFIELLVSHPVHRSKIWLSLFLGLSSSLVASFLLGAGIPTLVFAEPDKAGMMILVGVLVSVIFVAIAFLSSILSRDKAKGIGLAIIFWLYFALLFDGLILFFLFQFADYPIEKLLVGVTALSPIDLARILILLKLEVSAMMGYTGAIFQNFFGTSYGLLVSFFLLLCWVAVPFLISLRKFNSKDL